MLAEAWRLLDANARFPQRKNSKLKRTAKAVVQQGRGASGRFEGYTASSSLQVYMEEYAQKLDAGRAPGGKKVPLSALLDFIKNRNLRGRDKKTGKYTDANRLAWIIQNAIYRNGIRGRHFLAGAWDLAQQLTDIYINNQLLDGLTLELEQTLQFI
jgi:hypothetical protein